MRIQVIHERRVDRPPRAVFADLEAMGTAGDRIWPSRKMPFVRTPGPMAVGVTRESHGPIRALLDTYEPEHAIVWRSTVAFVTGTHGFRVSPLPDGASLVAHDLTGDVPWWFAPVWRAWMAPAHDRIVSAMLERLSRVPAES